MHLFVPLYGMKKGTQQARWIGIRPYVMLITEFYVN